MKLVPFEIVREDVGEYVTPGDIHLRVRHTLAYVWTTTDRDRRQRNIRTQCQFAVWAPGERKGPPNSGTTDQRLETWPLNRIRVIRAPRGIYEVEGDKILKLDFDLTDLTLLGAYDKDGEPVLNVNYSSRFGFIGIEQREDATAAAPAAGKHSARRAR